MMNSDSVITSAVFYSVLCKFMQNFSLSRNLFFCEIFLAKSFYSKLIEDSALTRNRKLYFDVLWSINRKLSLTQSFFFQLSQKVSTESHQVWAAFKNFNWEKFLFFLFFNLLYFTKNSFSGKTEAFYFARCFLKNSKMNTKSFLQTERCFYTVCLIKTWWRSKIGVGRVYFLCKSITFFCMCVTAIFWRRDDSQMGLIWKWRNWGESLQKFQEGW